MGATDGPERAGALALGDLIRADVEIAGHYFDSLAAHLFPNVYVAVSHRVAHALHSRDHRRIAGALAVVCHALTGAEIRPGAQLGPGLVIVHPSAIVIGGEVVAGRNLALWGSNTLGFTKSLSGEDRAGSPRLGDDVVLLTHASVIGPVTVGDRAVVAAYALVVDDVPADSTPRGIPART